MNTNTRPYVIKPDLFYYSKIDDVIRTVNEIKNLVGTEVEIYVTSDDRFKLTITQEMIDTGYFDKIPDIYSDDISVGFVIHRPLSPGEIAGEEYNRKMREERELKEYERLSKKFFPNGG